MNYLFRHTNNYRVYGILKKNFSQKSFSKNGMTLRNPTKNLRKESWQRFKWYNQMAQMTQVGTSGTGRSESPELRGTSGTRTRGSSDSVEQVEQGQGVCPVEPLHLTQCGTTRPCKIRPSHHRPISLEFLTICRIPGFPESEQNRKSYGNVRI